MDESGPSIYPVHAPVATNKGIAMTELKVGQKAPYFALAKDNGGRVTSRNSPANLWCSISIPRTTPKTCTAEAIDFSRLKPDFDQAGAALIGISPDSVSKHDKFKAKYKLSVDLAADEERKTIETYGLWTEKTMFGRKYMGVERATFLIGPDGKLAKIWRKVRVKGHADAVLAAVRNLRS
jgi:thioredoxin-dependent peroxiredoxin